QTQPLALTPRPHRSRLDCSRKWKSTNTLPSPLRHCSPILDDPSTDNFINGLPPVAVSPGTQFADFEIAEILGSRRKGDKQSGKTPEQDFVLDDQLSVSELRCSNPGIC
ncbi:hypothetical protein EIN_025790, partial [Entamoeba invadens IP1]|uniref:hypothetical protein n=1 Tax=Entamoeba invadens IP1 TaxID=370355 RepID=UPI0002C3FAFA